MKVQSSVIRDTIELTNLNGDVVKSIPFTINVTTLAAEVAKKRLELAKVDRTDAETLGKKTIELFALLFGEEATGQLLEYYEQDYATMMVDLSPVIVERIFPAFDALRDRAINLKKRSKRG